MEAIVSPPAPARSFRVSGEILADEAEALTGMIGTFLKALEITDLEDRLCKLEQASASAKPERFDA
jgi:hypothetical protein